MTRRKFKLRLNAFDHLPPQSPDFPQTALSHLIRPGVNASPAGYPWVVLCWILIVFGFG
jgi:hypothetical protein